MQLHQAVRLALAQIRVQKLKSFFTLLGVMIGVMFLIAVVSIVQGMNRYVNETFAGTLLGVNTFRRRRAEIKLSGKVTPSWGYEVQVDPAKTQSSSPGGDDKILLQDLGITFLASRGTSSPSASRSRDHRGRAPLLLRDRLRRALPDHPGHRRPAPDGLLLQGRRLYKGTTGLVIN